MRLERVVNRASPAPIARFVWLHGKPMIVLSDRLAGRILFDGVEGQVVHPDRGWLAEGAASLYPDARLVRVERQTRDDDYWYGPGRQLPVLKAVFDDPQRHWVYIDPNSGAIVGALNQDGRTWRWAFTALHDLDFAVLMRHRPAWDIVIWVLSLLGLATSVTGVVIGWRRLGRTFARKRKLTPAEGLVQRAVDHLAVDDREHRAQFPDVGVGHRLGVEIVGAEHHQVAELARFDGAELGLLAEEPAVLGRVEPAAPRPASRSGRR